MIVCKNCENNYEGNFCPRCGQRYIEKRFTLKDSIVWLFSSVFNLERGFVPTTLQLITKPGVTIRNYLSGITVRYAHPFRFVFIWATISAILNVYFGFFEDSQEMMSQTFGEEANYNEEQIEFTKKSNEVIRNYMSLVIMATIPFMSFFSYLLFKKKKYNYAEHLIVNAYANASSIVIGLPLLVFYFFTDNITLISTLSFSIGAFVMIRVYKFFFEVNGFIAFLKYVLTFAFTFLSASIIGVIVVIVIAIASKFLGLENPFEQAPSPQ